MTSPLPFAPAADRNKAAIGAVLQRWFLEPGLVLELGAGTGQHAAYLTQMLPHLRWLPTDLADRLTDIAAWRDAHPRDNLLAPMALDVTRQPWPIDGPDYLFSANTFHVLPWQGVVSMFAGAADCLPSGGLFCVYGPFAEAGRHNSPGNAAFDAALRARDAAIGIRDRVDIGIAAAAVGLEMTEQAEMPANNRMLLWRRT